MKMKTSNRMTVTLAGSLIVAVTVLLSLPGRAAAEGTDIFHYTAAEGMTNNGVEAGADGVVAVSEVKQGKADNEKVLVAVTGLTTNTPYELIVEAGTNMVDVTTFYVDRHGKGYVELDKLGNRHGDQGDEDEQGDQGDRHHRILPLPASLQPVTAITSVGILNSNAQLVLSADLTTPDRLDYLVKRNLAGTDGTNNVKATMMLQANAIRTRFQLLAVGLKPSSAYELAFNGLVVQTNTTTMRGRLDIHTQEPTPASILDLNTIELLDGTNVVLQTSLP